MQPRKFHGATIDIFTLSKYFYTTDTFTSVKLNRRYTEDIQDGVLISLYNVDLHFNVQYMQTMSNIHNIFHMQSWDALVPYQ